jgi:hypothetical protein
VIDLDSYENVENVLSSELCDAFVIADVSFPSSTRRLTVNGVEKEIPHFDLD